MSEDRKLLKIALAVGGIAGLALIYKSYFSESASTSSSLKTSANTSVLTAEKTRQLMQEIKYQMLVLCISFSEKIDKNILKLVPQAQRKAANDKMMQNMVKLYEQKEKLILDKKLIQKQDYTQALNTYENDEQLSNNKAQIFDMMDRAVNGDPPNLNVNAQALNLHSLDRMADIYREVCLKIVVAVWRQMFQCSQNDPNFDTSNDEHFKKAIRMINIYQLKKEYFISQGYKKQWGCPNEVFLKATESHNLRNPEFKAKIRAIEKAYNRMVDIVSNSPLTFKEEEIKQLLQDNIAEFQAQQINQKLKNQALNNQNVSQNPIFHGQQPQQDEEEWQDIE